MRIKALVAAGVIAVMALTGCAVGQSGQDSSNRRSDSAIRPSPVVT